MEPDEITRRRTALGLTQQQLADAVGVHRITVVRWEAGRAVPLGLALRLLGETFSRLERDQAGRAARRAAYAARRPAPNDDTLE
jgi:transcriptional regulator with XRE-family HTH domain